MTRWTFNLKMTGKQGIFKDEHCGKINMPFESNTLIISFESADFFPYFLIFTSEGPIKKYIRQHQEMKRQSRRVDLSWLLRADKYQILSG